MNKAALLLAFGLTAGTLAGTAWAQPTPDTPPMGPPPGAVTQSPYGGQQAQGPGKPHGVEGKFEAANVTHDGRLTQDQAQAAGWKGVAKHFAEIDRDNKGYVTEQDVKAWHRGHRAEKAAARQGQGQGPGQGGMQPPMQPQGSPPQGAPPSGSQPY